MALTVGLLLLPIIGPSKLVNRVFIASLAIPLAAVGFILLNLYVEVLLGALLGGILGGIWPGTPFLPTAVVGAVIGMLVVPMAGFFDVARIDRGALIGGTIGGGAALLSHSSMSVETVIAALLLGAIICSEP